MLRAYSHGVGTDMTAPSATRRSVLRRLIDCFDNDAKQVKRTGQGINWTIVWPFIGVHLACIALFWVGWSPIAVIVAMAMYGLRMFAITGFYHRYFSHRSFSTSRALQFVFAVIGNAAVQRGPLWWAAHHREHHANSDHEHDSHSPHQVGFWRAHSGWFLRQEAFATRHERVRDWSRFPELRFIDRFDLLVPIATATCLFALGSVLGAVWPTSETNGWQMLVWGFFVSTTVLYHATYTINSIAHVFGKRRFDTDDHSRNNWFLALLTFGEGWHNNHHHYPRSARQGFYWWEIDLTWYLLKAFSWCGLVWDLKPVPQRILENHQTSDANRQ